jgi:hypothetical protein
MEEVIDRGRSPADDGPVPWTSGLRMIRTDQKIIDLGIQLVQ